MKTRLCAGVRAVPAKAAAHGTMSRKRTAHS
jgi:hypothetical protein